MQLGRDGAQHFPAPFTPDRIDALRRAVAALPSDRPGTRLASLPGLGAALAPADAVAAALLGSAARPVRAVFFDKTPDRNWSLGWHQDRTIAVRRRIEVPGFTGWTVKSGIPHVVPPLGYLERMLTVRIHLDDAGADNGPLLVVPGSHRLGRIAEHGIAAAVDRLGVRACLARRGDLWAYATLILHASKPATAPSRRRVLQLLYSCDDLPGGLAWIGI